MKPKVYVAGPIPQEVEAYIGEHCDYRIWDNEEPIPRETLLNELAVVEGLLGAGQIDKELLERAPKLKIISNISVGYNNFDIEAMRARNVLGTNTPYVLDETVADLVFGLIINTARRLTELDTYVKDGKWKKGDNENLFGVDVHHSTLGIIGMGRIGEAIAQRAKFGFSMNVLYYNRNRKLDAEHNLGVEYSSLEDLLRRSDFVALMTPLSAETERFFGKEQFQQMKRTAIFINASRGQTVDELALIEALQQGEIHAAGLDVFDQEPVDPNNPLLRMSNVVTLPHIGSAIASTRFNMAMVAARNLVEGVTGGQPSDVVAELKKQS